ncbi:MAG: NAD-dependent epimerase/dehydratase family protein [bacterium]|nr:NAD-dependent epimerase/dehydratase family protein [bacterium]
MENVLVTGGAGFIGSHLTDLLIENNYNVIILDNLSTGNETNINPKAKFYNIDINSEKVEDIFKENKIDYIFHLAAQANVSFSTKYPDVDATENILGSIKILKLCKKYKIKKILLASTAAIYGKPEYLPVDEKHSPACLSCYGLSKLTMEQYTKLLDVNYIIFRFANVYGPRQSALGEAGVVAIFSDKMKKGEDITIDGDGEQTRDFIYVKDITMACLKAMQSSIKNTIINVSTAKAISINNLFEIMAQIFDYQKTPKHGERRFGDIRHSILDNSKCKEKLNFAPEVKIEEGLKALKEYN